ncbi:hypothetical protein SAMN05444672_1745 [Bacillus sp. OK838]|nr:hypothetical protein SAMN05444672_1745 [Bacillus sp. OK838]
MTNTLNRSEFEAKIKKAYNGAVTPVTRFVNEHCSMLFHCDKCGVEFWGKASHIVGKDHQKHVCTMPYGDKYGERLFKVGGGKHKPRKKNKGVTGERFYELVINDYTPNEIAKELEIPFALVIDYFKGEGLI